VDPLLDVTDSHSGHSTFTCGVIRQIESTAKIFVYPLMHSDCIVEEVDLDCQPDRIAARDDIDVVVMPFCGYASEETGLHLHLLLDGVAINPPRRTAPRQFATLSQLRTRGASWQEHLRIDRKHTA
jgi:hypothetical protein